MKDNYSLVIPGDNLGERKGRKLGGGVYLEGDKLFSSVLGILRTTPDEIFVIPLGGVYMPKAGDMVIGRIKSVEISGWFVDVNSPYIGFMPLAEAVEEYIDTSRDEMSKFFAVGDVIYCNITRVTTEKNVRVAMTDRTARKLETGVIVPVTPTKVPRIIGKQASMLKMITSATGCRMLVGQNGMVWVDGQNKAKAVEAILTIEKESHTEGLTDRIAKMLGV